MGSMSSHSATNKKGFHVQQGSLDLEPNNFESVFLEVFINKEHKIIFLLGLTINMATKRPYLLSLGSMKLLENNNNK